MVFITDIDIEYEILHYKYTIQNEGIEFWPLEVLECGTWWCGIHKDMI